MNAKEFSTITFPCVQAPGDCSHRVLERLQHFSEGLSGEPPDSLNVVVEQLVVLDDVRV